MSRIKIRFFKKNTDEELFDVYLSNEIMTPAYIYKVIKSKKNN